MTAAQLADVRAAAVRTAEHRYGPQHGAAYLGFVTGVDTTLELIRGATPGPLQLNLDPEPTT